MIILSGGNCTSVKKVIAEFEILVFELVSHIKKSLLYSQWFTASSFFGVDLIASGNISAPKGHPHYPSWQGRCTSFFTLFVRGRQNTRIVLVRILNIRILETEQKLFLTNCDKKNFCLFFLGIRRLFLTKELLATSATQEKRGWGGVGKNFWLRYSIHAKDLLLCKVEEYDQT